MSEYVAQSIIISDICHLLPSPRVLSPLAASTFLGERKGQISAFHIREKNHVSHYNAKNLYMSKHVAQSIVFSEICHLLPIPRILVPPPPPRAAPFIGGRMVSNFRLSQLKKKPCQSLQCKKPLYVKIRRTIHNIL